MARITSALLCDAATVREGLVHILGGGITRLNRPEYPSPMMTGLALAVVLSPLEAGHPHEVVAIVQTEDGEAIVQANGQLQPGEPSPLLEPGESVAIQLAIPLHQVVLPAAGGYSIEISVDDIHQLSLPFRAVLIPA